MHERFCSNQIARGCLVRLNLLLWRSFLTAQLCRYSIHSIQFSGMQWVAGSSPARLNSLSYDSPLTSWLDQTTSVTQHRDRSFAATRQSSSTLQPLLSSDRLLRRPRRRGFEVTSAGLRSFLRRRFSNRPDP